MFVESIRRALPTDSVSSGFGDLRESSRILQIRHYRGMIFGFFLNILIHFALPFNN